MENSSLDVSIIINHRAYTVNAVSNYMQYVYRLDRATSTTMTLINLISFRHDLSCCDIIQINSPLLYATSFILRKELIKCKDTDFSIIYIYSYSYD